MIPRELDELILRYPVLLEVQQDIYMAFQMMVECFTSGNKLLLCGNGGSAADVEHFSGELLKNFEMHRKRKEQEELPLHLRDKLHPALPVIPLTGFLSFSTAFGNDVDPVYTYAQLVWALGRPGDLLLGISTSGNARNVYYAIEVARCKQLKTIALTGASGGKMAEIAHLSVKVPAQLTRHVQELHLPVYHTWAIMLENHFFATS